MSNNEIKTVNLTYQVIKQNDKGRKFYGKPITIGFSYSENLGEIPISMVIDKLDEAYDKLKELLIMEDLKNEN